MILMNTTQKARFDAFTGVATKYNEVKGQNQASIIGSADVYISSFGNHVVKLDRYVRDSAVLCIDPEYIAVGTLRPMQRVELAKTGDGSKEMLVVEYCNIVLNRDAHSVVGGCV